MALSTIAAVDLSMSFSRQSTRIVLLRADDVERFVRYRQGTFAPGETLGLVSFLRGLHGIDVSGLPAAGRLALAELIREAVQGPSAQG